MRESRYVLPPFVSPTHALTTLTDTPLDLVELARTEQIEALDQAWTACLEDPKDVDACCRTLSILCEHDMASRALPMASTLVDALAEKDRLVDAYEVGMTLVRLEAHNENLSKQLLSLIERRFSNESWYQLVCDLSKLDSERVTRDALDAFERTRRYTNGHVVYHRAGWGSGLVEEYLTDRQELRIRFESGRVQEVPVTTALDSMTALDDDDLRSMLMTAPEELSKLAAESPAVLIRKAAKIYRRVSSSEVKSLLSPAVVPTKKWATFWKKAKAAAALDPYLQVEGSTSRPIFELRKKPLSLADEAELTLQSCDNLGEEVAHIRGYLDRSNDVDTQAAMLRLVGERIEAAARSEGVSHAHILDGVLLLEKHGLHPSTSAASELAAMLVTADGQVQPENFNLLATQDAREHAVALLPDALGEQWSQHCIDTLLHFPASVVEPVVELLIENGQVAGLITLWDQVAPYPQRHPMLTYLLGKQFADGAFDGIEDAPGRIAVARVLLHLGRVLSSQRKRNHALHRLLTRVASLLAGRRPFFADVLVAIDRETMGSFLGISERGGPEFPQEVSDQILKAVSARFPELTAIPDRPFWEADAIFVTRDGLASKQEEYRKLVDEQIPANSAAIGAAASHGDLSENSEWESAVEEQRNLATRATMLDEDLRKAKLLEDVEIPAGVAAPGTAVTYTNLRTNEQHKVKFLGPWDSTSEDVINYLAPFAQPILGKAAGEEATITSDGVDSQVRIDEVEQII